MVIPTDRDVDKAKNKNTFLPSLDTTVATGTKLDDLAAPDDNTDLNATTAVHGLLPKGPNEGKFLRDDITWVAPAGAGDMLKATYDPNADDVIAAAQLDPALCTQTLADTKVATHAALTTGVHGVGAGTVAKTSDITATKLDDLATPDDNTDLNFGITRHGLVPKGTNLGKVLFDDATWNYLDGGTAASSF